MARAETEHRPDPRTGARGRKTAFGLLPGPADGRVAFIRVVRRHHATPLCLLVESIEEVASPVALVGQENASARRPGQSASGDLVASGAWAEHRGDYYRGRLVNERMGL